MQGDGIREASRFVPSRGVLLGARKNPSRIYNPLSSFLLHNGFLTFLFSLSPKDLQRSPLFELDPPYTSTMKPKSDLTLDSSSIRGRVRSKKQKTEVGPSESMDSTSSSLDLTAEIENPSRVVAEVASSGGRSRTGERSIISPMTSPSGSLVPYIGEIKEIPVYEGFFESGFRDRVPSLVAKVSEALEISLGKLNPPSWKTLIAMQNLGRYHLHPSGMELPVQEISKKERKRHPVFDGRWTDKFAFMHLPEFSSAWRTAGGPACVDSSLGKRTTERPFSCEQRSTGTNQRRGSTGRVQESFKVMSAKKAAPKRAAPSENDYEVQFIKCSKRQAMTAPASSSKKKSKASGSTPKVSPSLSCDKAIAFANLNAKVFPLIP
ncbi:hypothetical protein HID58_042950, partial [Brassica napus]